MARTHGRCTACDPGEFVSPEQIRAGIERMRGLWDYFVQTTYPGTIQIAGDTAVGRAYVSEFGRMRDALFAAPLTTSHHQ